MPDHPTITSKNVPTPAPALSPSAPAPAPPEVVPSYADIEAKPLRAPNFINLVPINPNVSIRWGNRSVGVKESTMRYDELIAMGFVPAEPKDVKTSNGLPCPPSLVKDNRVFYGDVILLKIARKDYIGALKWNEQSARLRVKKPGVYIDTGASKDVGGREVLADDGGRKSVTAAAFPKKVSTYVPQLAETDAKTADNSGPTSDFNLADK